jgi:hypothetical protein
MLIHMGLLHGWQQVLSLVWQIMERFSITLMHLMNMLLLAIFNTHRANCIFTTTVNISTKHSIKYFKPQTPSPNKKSTNQSPRLDLELKPLNHPQYWKVRLGIVAAVMHIAAMEMVTCLPMEVCQEVTMTAMDMCVTIMQWQQVAMEKV